MTSCSGSSGRDESLVDHGTLGARLARLREALRELAPIAAMPLSEYLAAPTSRALAEHYLRIALEAMLDLGNHLIAARGLKKPLTLRQIPIILAESNVLDQELGSRLARAAGLRNRLVHEYADLDHAVIHASLAQDLADLAEFAIALARACEGGK